MLHDLTEDYAAPVRERGIGGDGAREIRGATHARKVSRAMRVKEEEGR
jgi:hypothetical protein